MGGVHDTTALESTSSLLKPGRSQMKTSFPSSSFTSSPPPALPSPPPPSPSSSSLALECSLCQSSKRTLLGSFKGIGSNLPSETSDLKISASSLRGKKVPLPCPSPAIQEQQKEQPSQTGRRGAVGRNHTQSRRSFCRTIPHR